MVLHLLGKKSWNVYNSENVERVRRDEAEAQAREDAEEQRMQDEDSHRRLAILRGETPAEPRRQPFLAEDFAKVAPPKLRHGEAGHRKRRRLRGEDDTDRDIRHAREDAEAGEKARRALIKHDEVDAPLHDDAGNIQLIPEPDEKSTRKADKNAEAEAEKAKKRKRDEDQYTMRFSNAAGFNNGVKNPWYASSKTNAAATTTLALADVQSKDVWGNEDPLRREREKNRISTNDPLAAMQQAQRQLKRSEADRESWKKERETEIEDLKRSEDRRRRSNKKHGRDNEDEDSLENFSLDSPSTKHRARSKRDSGSRHHRRRENR